MPRTKISNVFSISPIGAEDKKRSYVERPKFHDQLIEELCSAAPLLVSGYSGVGKTSAINKALLPLKERRTVAQIGNPEIKKNSRYDRIIFFKDPIVFVDQGLESAIFNRLKGYLPAAYQDYDSEQIDLVAEAVEASASLLIFDNIQDLLYQPQAKEIMGKLRRFLKLWSELPRGGPFPQSKIVLIAAEHQAVVAPILQGTIRLNVSSVYIEPWHPQDLTAILDAGCRYLNLEYSKEIREHLVYLSCGLPSTFTLLAQLTAQNAADGDRDPKDKRVVSDFDYQALIHEERALNDLAGNISGNLDLAEEVCNRSLPELVFLAFAGLNQGYAVLPEIEEFFDKHQLHPAPLDSLDSLKRADLVFDIGRDRIVLSELIFGSVAMLQIRVMGYQNQDIFHFCDRIFSDLLRLSERKNPMGLETILVSAFQLLIENARTVLRERSERRAAARKQRAEPQDPPDENAITSTEMFQAALSDVNMQLAQAEQYHIEKLTDAISGYRGQIDRYKVQLARGLGVDERVIVEERLEKLEDDLATAAQDLRNTLESVVNQRVDIPYLD